MNSARFLEVVELLVYSSISKQQEAFFFFLFGLKRNVTMFNSVCLDLYAIFFSFPCIYLIIYIFFFPLCILTDPLCLHLLL